MAGRRRWVVAGAVTLAGIGVATTAARSAVQDADAPPLTVVVSDAATAEGEACPIGAYAGTFFDGAVVELRDGDGGVVGTTTLRAEDVAADRRGCSWTVSFPQVPPTETYTVELRTTGSLPRVHTYELARTELVAREWTVWISAVG